MRWTQHFKHLTESINTFFSLPFSQQIDVLDQRANFHGIYTITREESRKTEVEKIHAEARQWFWPRNQFQPQLGEEVKLLKVIFMRFLHEIHSLLAQLSFVMQWIYVRGKCSLL